MHDFHVTLSKSFHYFGIYTSDYLPINQRFHSQFVMKDIKGYESIASKRDTWDEVCGQGSRASMLSPSVPLSQQLHMFTIWKLSKL